MYNYWHENVTTIPDAINTIFIYLFTSMHLDYTESIVHTTVVKYEVD